MLFAYMLICFPESISIS